MDEIYLTREGYQKLHDELERLRKERYKISAAIEEARLQGDLSENAEYDAAKDAQAQNNFQISTIEGKLAKVRIIEDENIPGDKVYIGAIVSLKDLNSGEKLKYQMLSPEEADYDKNRLSIFAPIGKGLMGKGEGEEVEIEVPAGVLKYKITKIERPT